MERVVADRIGHDEEEITRAGSEWPVPDHYRVEAPTGSAERDPAGTTVVAAAPARARRFPLRAGIPLAVVLLLLLGSLALIPLLTSPPERSESALADPESGLGGTAAPAPQKVSTTPSPGEATEIEVPDVKGLSGADARRALRRTGLKVRTRRAESDRRTGIVLEQEPSAGERIDRGSLVILVVSDGGGNADVAVPSLVGLRADSAGRLARAKGLRVEVRFVRSTANAGLVVSQQPSGGEPAVRGSVVELRVARTRPVVTTVRIPRVEGLHLAEAKARLRARGLRWSVETEPSSRPPGIVLRQSSRSGAVVEKGTRVVLAVSSGPLLGDVPDVVGLDVVLARQQLEAAGFLVVVSESPTTDPAEDGIVLEQSPGGGTRLREGAEVTISVGLAG